MNIKGQVVELTKVASNNYKGVSLFTDETQTEYKSIYQYLKEISEIYDELGAKQKQELLEKLFGKNRAQVGAAILSQMDTATEALKTMENAEGSAAREMEVVSNSVTFALNKLKETLTGIAQSNITQDFLKNIINDATRFLEVFKNSEATIRPVLTVFEKLVSLVVSLTEAFGGLGTIIGGIALKNVASGTGFFRVVASEANKAKSEILLFGKSLSEVKAILSKLNPINILNSFFSSEKKNTFYDADKLKKFTTYLENSRINGSKINSNNLKRFFDGTSEATQKAGQALLYYNNQLEQGKITQTEYDTQVKAIITDTNNLSASQKAAAASASLLRGALSLIGQVGIMLAISAIIKGISWLIERQKQFKQSIDDVNSSAQELRDTLKELSDHSDAAKEFVELSKGVNSLGENVSLTADEFDRYHQIANQIAEDLPSRVIGYDEEGNAILNLKESVESLTAAYRAAKQEAISEAYYSKEGTKQRKDALKNAYNNLGLGYFNTDAQGYKISEGITKIQQKEFLENVLKKTKEDLLDDYNNNAFSAEEIQLLFGLGITKEKIEENYDQIKNTLKSQVNQLNTEINKSAKAVKEILNQSLWVDVDFQGLSEQQQTALSIIVQNLSPQKLGELAQGGEEAIQNYTSELIDSYTQAMYANGYKITKAREEILSFDFSKISVKDAKAKIDEFYQDVANMLGNEVDAETVKLLYPVEIDIDGKSIDELYEKEQALRQQIADIAFQVPTDGDKEAIDSVFDELNLKTEEEMVAFSKLLVQYNNLTEAKEAYLKMTDEEIVAAADLHDTFTYTDYADQIETINKNVDALDKALETLKKGEDLDNSDIDNLVKLFPEYSNNILAASNNTGQLEAVLERIKSGAAADFIETLRGLKGLSEEEQQAVDNLIKRYTEYSVKLESNGDILKDVADKESTLDSIHKELNGTGNISVSTYMKLIEYGEDYSKLVTIENGQLKISEQAYKDLVVQKYKDQEATYELAKAEKIRELAVKSSIGASESELDAIRKQITEYARLADDARKNSNTAISLFTTYTPTGKGSGNSDSETKKQYSQDLQILKDNLNDKVITYEQFLQQWQALNEKYHNMSEEDGGISDYEYNQNNRDIIDERKNAYNQKKKELQELYETGQIGLDEYNSKVNTALNEWLGGYAQLSDEFKEQTKENAEFAKTHFFDVINNDLDDLQEKYEKTGDSSFLDDQEALINGDRGLGYVNKKLAELDKKGIDHNSDEYQYWLGKQKEFNNKLKGILDTRNSIIDSALNDAKDAAEETYEKTGDNSVYMGLAEEIKTAKQAKLELIDAYKALGFKESSKEIKDLRDDITELDNQIVDTYKDYADSVIDIADRNVDAIKKTIEVTGDKSLYDDMITEYQGALDVIDGLIKDALENGESENSAYVLSLKGLYDDLADKIKDVNSDIVKSITDTVDENVKNLDDLYTNTNDSKYLYDKIDTINQGKESIKNIITQRLSEGYSEDSELVKKLLEQVKEYDDDIKDIYSDIADDIVHDTENNVEVLEKKIEQTGNKSLYNDIVQNYKDARDAIGVLIQDALANGEDENGEYIQGLKDKYDDLGDKIVSTYNDITDAITDSIDKQLDEVDRLVDSTGDYSHLYDKIGIYNQGKQDIAAQIGVMLTNGYSMESESVQNLVKKLQEYDDEILNVYSDLADNIEDETKKQIDIIDKEIERTGDTSKYQIKLDVLVNEKKSIQNLIDTLLAMGIDANSKYVKDLKEKLSGIDENISGLSKERADAQAKAYSDLTDEENDRLKEYQKQQDEIFDKQLDALKKKKEALEKQNAEIEKQNELQEKQNSLLDAQRGVIKSLRMVYSGNGTWSVKPTEESLENVKKAEQELDSYLRKQEIEKLSELIEAIKASKETFDTGIEKQIEANEKSATDFTKAMTDSYKVYSQLDAEFIKSILGEDSANKFIDNFNQTAQTLGIDFAEQQTATDDQTESTKDLTSATDKATSSLEQFGEIMQQNFGEGNVDLTKRPLISSDQMKKAGYDVEDGGISTVYTETHFVWQGDEETGKYVAVHVTPILPNGEVLTPEEMEEYVYGQLQGNSNILEADSKGIVLKVDTDLGLSEKDIASLKDGNLTQHMKDVLEATDSWDEALHIMQEAWVNMCTETVGIVEEKTDEAKSETENVTTDSADNNSEISDVAEKGKTIVGILESVGNVFDFAKKFLNGELSITSLPSDTEALKQLAPQTIIKQQTVNNVSNYTPNITNNFTINAPANSAEEIKNAVMSTIDTRITQSFKAFCDGHYQGTLSTAYGR